MECTNADLAVMEMSLGHVVASAVAEVYARGELIKKRRALMDAWGLFVTGQGGADSA